MAGLAALVPKLEIRGFEEKVDGRLGTPYQPHAFTCPLAVAGHFMSLFGTLKKAIFHNSAALAAGSAQRAQATASAPPAGVATPQPAAVDIEAVLEALNAKSSQKLNWRTSIVDLMKFVGLDSSLQHRRSSRPSSATAVTRTIRPR